MSIRRSPIFLAIALVAGCGFHQRGSFDLPETLKSTYVEAPGVDRKVTRGIAQSLRASGASVVEDRAQATAILNVRQFYDVRVLSVSDATAIQELELFYQLIFSLKDASGNTILADQRVEMFRDYTYDKNNILGTQSEETGIREDMMQDAVQQMMRRIRASVS